MRFATVLATLAVGSTFLVSMEARPAAAANPSHFDPSYIISDANFYSGNAMTEAEIQAFLVAKGSGLATYRSNVTSRPPRPSADIPGLVYCEAFQGGTSLLASTVIFRAQKACNVSAKVLLVTMQKEQGLILKSSFGNEVLAAMGYGCPDTAACNETHYGLGNQLYMASLQFRFYQQRFNNFRYQVGNEYVAYSTDPGCGGSTLNIQSWATAALYNYTPYQPNAAAIAAYPGTAHCGSYGNRNFWFLYSDWFGSPTGVVPGGNPRGAYDEASLTASKDAAFIRGWAFDADTVDPILVDIYVDSAWNRTLTANQSRPDVQAAYPTQSPNHGFSATIRLAPGAHSVCAYAINVGSGNLNTPLGCKSVTVPAAPPVEPPTPPVDPPVDPPVPPVEPPAPEADTGAAPRGDVNEMRASGSAVFLRGWTFDPDTVNPIRADVWVNGAWTATLVANQARPDVKAAFPAQGPNHGFSGTFALKSGSNRVCVYGINNGRGANPLLQCRTLSITGTVTPPPTTPPPAAPGGTHNPRGDMNQMTLTGSSLFMRGWTFDADTKESILADIWVNGRWKSTMNANVARSDVQAAFPNQGPNHGFSSSINLARGTNQVCVYGINNNAGGANPLIQCRSFTVN